MDPEAIETIRQVVAQINELSGGLLDALNSLGGGGATAPESGEVPAPPGAAA